VRFFEYFFNALDRSNFGFWDDNAPAAVHDQCEDRTLCWLIFFRGSLSRLWPALEIYLFDGLWFMVTLLISTPHES